MISSRARSPAHMNGVVGLSSLDPEKYIYYVVAVV